MTADRLLTVEAAAERLSVIGMALSEAMLARVSEAMKAGEAVDTGAVALEYSRLSRSVRQTLALEARFDAAGADLAKALTDERTARRERAEQARADRIQFNFDCVEAAVGEAILGQGFVASLANPGGIHRALWRRA